jgi:hypothetical protein
MKKVSPVVGIAVVVLAGCSYRGPLADLAEPVSDDPAEQNEPIVGSRNRPSPAGEITAELGILAESGVGSCGDSQAQELGNPR